MHSDGTVTMACSWAVLICPGFGRRSGWYFG